MSLQKDWKRILERVYHGDTTLVIETAQRDLALKLLEHKYWLMDGENKIEAIPTSVIKSLINE